MTNEQLTQEIVKLHEQQAESKAEHEKFELVIKELQEDVKSTKALAEDVHIMAINMQNLQKAQEETNKKVDALSTKEFNEYEENKKFTKQKILDKIIGAIWTVITIVITWIASNYFSS